MINSSLISLPVFSLRSTTPHQPRVLAPPPLPHLRRRRYPQMTVSAPRMSWPRSGYATGGGCRTARAWTKSAMPVEVNTKPVPFPLFLPRLSSSSPSVTMPPTGGPGGRGGGRGGQLEGRRATISSALELEGTVSHEGDLTNFITKNLEQKIKMSSKPSLDCSDCEYRTGTASH